MTDYYDNKIKILQRNKERKRLLEENRIRCSKCFEIKSIDMFDKSNPKKNDKYRKDCKECRKKRNQEYHKKTYVKKRHSINHILEIHNINE